LIRPAFQSLRCDFDPETYDHHPPMEGCAEQPLHRAGFVRALCSTGALWVVLSEDDGEGGEDSNCLHRQPPPAPSARRFFFFMGQAAGGKSDKSNKLAT
jgi:hypothetical protein